MPLCPLQTGSRMTCCKHLFHIGPPWPNELPESVQHCLFADTVLPCSTCRRLKTTSKVRQRNEPVHSRVCNPWSTGSTAICHPTCLLETLAQPNYCVSVTTKHSTDYWDIVATSSMVNAWIHWFWFSLGMFNDKRCEIKCVFSNVVGIRIMSIHIICNMYLHLGLHLQIRLYYVLPYNGKIKQDLPS